MLSLSRINRGVCQECRRIRAKISEEGLCGNCWKKSLDNVRGQVVLDMKVDEQVALVAKIIGANKLRMEVVRSFPKSLRQWWSKAGCITMSQLLKAGTKETLIAIEKWTKLKSVFVNHSEVVIRKG